MTKEKQREQQPEQPKRKAQESELTEDTVRDLDKDAEDVKGCRVRLPVQPP